MLKCKVHVVMYEKRTLILLSMYAIYCAKFSYATLLYKIFTHENLKILEARYTLITNIESLNRYIYYACIISHLNIHTHSQ